MQRGFYCPLLLLLHKNIKPKCSKHSRECKASSERQETLKVTKHWHRVPRGVVESLSLEIFKSPLDTALGSLL